MSGIIINQTNIETDIYPKLDSINTLLSSAYENMPYIKMANYQAYFRSKASFVEAEIDDLQYDIRKIKNSIATILATSETIENKSTQVDNLNIGSLQTQLTKVFENSIVHREEIALTNLVNAYEKDFKYNFFPSGFRKRIEERDANIKACYNKYILGDKFDNYILFRNCLVQDRFVSKPSRDTSFATQGVCDVKGTTFMTSYDTGYDVDSNGECREKKKSVLEIVGEHGEIKTLYFDNKAHVGGIGYSEEREMFYISGSGEVNYYSLEYLASIPDGSEIIPECSYKLEESEGKGNSAITKASFLTTNQNDVWVGEFQFEEDYKAGSKAEIRRYETDELGNMIAKELYELPYRNVQGMCVTKYNNQEYYVFSTSEGRKTDSYLKVCTLENGEFKEQGKMVMPCLSEQVSLTDDGNLMIVFESDCTKYGDGADNKGKSTKQVGNVCYLDLEKVLESCDVI